MRAARGACTLAMAGLLLSCQASAGSGVARSNPSLTPNPTRNGAPTISYPTDVQLSAPSASVVWALVAYTVLFVSTDGGRRWSQRSLPPTLGLPPSIAFVDEREGWLLTTGSPETQCNAESVSIWHTTDGAATWAQLPAQGIADLQCKRHISFADSTHGFFSAWDDNHRPTVYRTSDGGATWAGSVVPDPPGFVTQGGGFMLQVGSIRTFGDTVLAVASGRQDGDAQARVYVVRSTDGGATWPYAARLPEGAGTPAIVTATRWLLITPDGPSLETTNAGGSWHAFASDYQQAAGVAPQIVFGDPLTGYATVRGEIQRTADGGAQWVTVNSPGT